MSNREIRRREAKRDRKKRDPKWQLMKVATENELLNGENELSVWSSTLTGYQTATRYFQLQLQTALIMESSKVDTHLMRKWFSRDWVSIDEYHEMRIQISNRSKRALFQFDGLREGIKRFPVAYSNEDYHEIWNLFKDQEIDPMGIMKEFYRHSAGMRDLTAMHVS